ncbi:M24 family metallopeptidase [Aquibaculum arenosum]|uniref:Xaa-Pro peptidase family protein n=1 Tax=Aquibaculum arenosum TaxID=3032591 RepID=A0ABT5YL41_9PROT|nr:Xaa-Pro peptidase family protein [Fodinicurvata sp. CAU 1616]MDF2095671.1 Xaa-Pro peptidase family protein [Fodinicurvata sp. CAU 1616]
MTHPRPDSPSVVPSGPAFASDAIPSALDPVRLRAERLARLRAMMDEQGYAAVVLFDPYNQRYATGSRNMFGYFLRNSTRYIYVPLNGPVILFEYPGSAHISTCLETIDESRTSKVVWSSVNQRDGAVAQPFAQEIADLLKQQGGGKVGLDRCSHILALALEAEGVTVEDCQQHILHARRIKTTDEVACLALSMASSEAAVDAMARRIRPGVSETELFATMYGEVIAGGGEFIETRLLSSGPRTNPWFAEASDRRIRPGELVAMDTDTIGVNGYYSDFSRTFFCGPGRPSGYQKSLYSMAWEQVHHNMALLGPGKSYREIAESAWKIPERFLDRRYPSIIHGVGMHGETPLVAHSLDFDSFSGDGVLEPGMVVSVESYIGEVDGPEGVKLEEEVLITESGIELLSRYPFDEQLLEKVV